MEITIVTHDKRFHADDVASVSLLTSLYSNMDYEVKLIRTRDPELWKKADILVDVGGVYDPDEGKFDHHQTSCNDTFSPSCKIPMSSVGMVWKHYGQLILEKFNENLEAEDIENLHSEIYYKTILELDGHDNGILPIEGGTKNYNINMTIGSIISSLNSESRDDEDDQMNRFREAVRLFGELFEIKFNDIISKYLDYKRNLEIIRKHITSEEYIHIPIKTNTIYRCLNEVDREEKIKFLILSSENDKDFTVRTRNKSNSFSPMIPLINEVSAKKLLDDDLVFIHKNLFIGKTKTLESAILLVKASLKSHQNFKYGTVVCACVGIGGILWWLKN